ncbi:MAG: molybdopterin-binding protein, partial [Terracidiphilus sp.]
LTAARDTAEELDQVLGTVVESGAELLLVSGGVSAGRFDLVEPALQGIGAQFHFTGVRMQPGKPVVFGQVPARGRTLPFFGLPGNPISSSVTFLLFGAPLLAALAGCGYEGPRFAMARLSDATDRNATLTRFLPAWCGPGGSSDAPQVAPVPWHGSGDLPAFGRSNCFVMVPEGIGGLAAGEMVRILMV